jgi:hypothetical protein
MAHTLYQQEIEYNLITTIKLISIMKKLLIILLSVAIIADTIAQNTLDNIGLTASAPSALAYSFRQLSSTYSGNAIQVRRSNDNTTQDIGFVGGELDTASLKTFVGSNSAFISIWYDQSGNATNLSQGTASNQPRIVNAGVIDRENGKPFVRFFGTVSSSAYKSLNLSSASNTTAQIIVVNKFASGGAGFILGHTSSYNWHSDYPNGKLFISYSNSSVLNGTVFQNGRSIAPLTAVWNTTLMINSVAPSTPSTGTTWDNIGSDRNFYHNTSGGAGYSELIIFSSAITAAQRLTVEINQSNYYSITLSGSLNKNGKRTTVSTEYVNRNGALGGSNLYETGQSVATLLPVMASTAAASSITSVSAVSGGSLTSDGGGAPLTVGICWNTSTNPTISNSTTAAAGTTGSFTANLTSLMGSTTYYVRAYATNSVGTVYGNEVSFTTLAPVVPTLTATTAISLITSTSAQSGGNVTSDGGATITARGVCWSTSPSPTISDSKTTNGSGLGSFSSNITGLTLGVTYYVRSYATNSAGTGYGSQTSFTTRLGIGDSYAGGTIGYIFQSGDPGYVNGETHGLIVASSIQSSSVAWYNGSYTTTGATATQLGTGNANTNTIVASLGAGTYAAKLCDDLVSGGYSDWYLPSRDELNKLNANKNLIGGFPSGGYWSSSETSANNAWKQSFQSDNQNNYSKDYLGYVRAVRSF